MLRKDVGETQGAQEGNAMKVEESLFSEQQRLRQLLRMLDAAKEVLCEHAHAMARLCY